MPADARHEGANSRDVRMNSDELAGLMAAAAGIEKKVAAIALNAFVVAVRGTVARGSVVKLSGLGRFAAAQLKARNGKNPRTGADISVAASKRMSFKALPSVVKIINGGQ